MQLVNYTASLMTLSPSLRERLLQIFPVIKFNKGDSLITSSKKCDTLFFIHKGLLRSYHFEDGKEITNWFAKENDFATCFYAFICQSNSTETIEALEDGEATCIKYKNLQDLYKEFPESEKIGRMITETYYIQLEDRLQELKLKSAKERYAALMKKSPDLLQRASLGHIAGYLGISAETLSRIRAEI